MNFVIYSQINKSCAILFGLLSAMRVFIVQGLRKYEYVHIPGITPRLDSILPLKLEMMIEVYCH